MDSKARFVSVAFLSLTSACGIRIIPDPNVAPPDPPTTLELKAPEDISGSWQQCSPWADHATGAVYTFHGDGSLTFDSMLYLSKDCRDQGTIQFTLPGSFAVGRGNTLDMTMGGSTVFRVFATHDDQLLISNNAGAGGDRDNRDAVLNRKALVLFRLLNN